MINREVIDELRETSRILDQIATKQRRQVVEAYNAGVSKVDIHRATGRARATIVLWLRLEDQAESNRSNR